MGKAKSIVWSLFGILCVFGGLSLFAHATHATSGINQQINYQARLLDATGATVPDGTYNIEFKIYQDGTGCVSGGSSPCGGTLKWTETRTGSNKVAVKNGYFSVQLGSVTPFGSSVNWNWDTLWLSINIGGVSSTPSWDGEMLPFRQLDASPYALNSNQLGGLMASQFLQLAPSSVQADSGTTSSIFINKTGASGNILELQKSGSDVATIGNSGAFTLQNATDSTAAFQIKNQATGANLFTVDTTNTAIALGNDGTPTALKVRGGAASGSSVAGSDLTFDASNGTGQANSGDIVFRTAKGSSQVTFDASASGSTTGATSLTISHTVASQSNRLLIVTISTQGTINTVTYNGASMTKLGTTVTCGASACKGELWSLAAPTTGTHNVVITASASTSIQASVAGFYNVDQTTPLGTPATGSGTTATATATVMTTTTQMVVDTVISDGTVDVINNQSQTLVNNVNTSNMNGLSYKAAQSTSTTMSWNVEGATGGNWAIIAVPINAAASSTTTSDTLTESLRINAQGRVGIGTNSPGDQLDVAGGGMRFQTSGATLNLASDVLGNTFNIKIPAKVTGGTCASGNAEGLRFVTPSSTNGTIQVGHICMSGANASPNYALKFYANAFTASSTDLAENYSDKDNSLQPADIVALDPTTKKGVKKTTSAQESGMLGIVSTEPGLALSDISDTDGSTDLIHPKPIALSGRVPTKVSTINGDIQVGDYLTSSPIPGVAMKATRAGQVVAKALENYTSADPHTVGVILSFVNLSWNDPDPQSVVGISDQLGSFTSSPVIFKANSDSINAFQIQNTNGEPLLVADTAAMQVTITNLVVTTNLMVNGHIIAGGSVPTVSLGLAACSNPTIAIAGNDTLGRVAITTGHNCNNKGTLATVTFKTTYGSAPIVLLTPEGQPAAGLMAYATTTPNNFTIDSSIMPSELTTYVFNYFIGQVASP